MKAVGRVSTEGKVRWLVHAHKAEFIIPIVNSYIKAKQGIFDNLRVVDREQ